LCLGQSAAAQQSCTVASDYARRYVEVVLRAEHREPWFPSLGITTTRVEELQPLTDASDAGLCRRMNAAFARTPASYFRAGRYFLGTDVDVVLLVSTGREGPRRGMLLFDSTGTVLQRPPRPIETDAVAGLHIGSPAIISFAMGPTRDLWRKYDRDVEETGSLFALVEPGVNASRLSVGYSRSINGMLFTAASRATALRIWRGDSVGNYLGAEGSVMMFAVQGRIGLFRQIGPNATTTTRVTVDLSLGL
jgi:hypothetical protein